MVVLCLAAILGTCMKSVGIREAKAHFSELVRAAANGERIVLTHHGEPLAVITSTEEGSASGWLGVRIQPVDDTIADNLGLGTARGVLIASVDDKGPAKPAGLMPGDVIVKFDGKDIKESRDLQRLVPSTFRSHALATVQAGASKPSPEAAAHYEDRLIAPLGVK